MLAFLTVKRTAKCVDAREAADFSCHCMLHISEYQCIIKDVSGNKTLFLTRTGIFSI